jgi:hypothetical protein
MVAGLEILSSEFSAFQSLKFITLRYGGIPYAGGALRPLKMNEATLRTWEKCGSITFMIWKSKINYLSKNTGRTVMTLPYIYFIPRNALAKKTAICARVTGFPGP